MFRELLLGLFTVRSLADYLDVSPRTVQRWYAKNKAPTAVIRLLQCLRGELAHIHTTWQGWTIGKDGILYSPDGLSFTTGHILAGIYERQLIQHLRKQVRELLKERKEFKFITTAANEW